MNILKNMKKINDFDKLQLMISLILIWFVTIVGATYAYFSISEVEDDIITGNMATVKLDLDVEKVFPVDDNNTGVLVPQVSFSGSENSPLSSALKSGCVDANGNLVCQVYKVFIKNDGGSATLVVDGSIHFYSDTLLSVDVQLAMPNLRWKLIDFADKVSFSNSVLGTNYDIIADSSGDDNIFANDLTLVTNQSKIYYIIIWIDESGSEQIDVGNSFYASIEVNASNGTGVTATFAS